MVTHIDINVFFPFLHQFSFSISSFNTEFIEDGASLFFFNFSFYEDSLTLQRELRVCHANSELFQSFFC